MLVWNDLEADEKLKIYDKGVDVKTRENVMTFWLVTGQGMLGCRG